MLKNRNAQGMSIGIIIASIIGLIIIVAVVALLTGKLGDFRFGTKKFGDISKTCFDLTGSPPKEECPGGTIASSDSLAEGKKCCGEGVRTTGDADGVISSISEEPGFVDIT